MKTALSRGFTLVELLVVIAIIGILAGFLAVGLPRALESAKIADVEGDMHGLRTALTQYYADNGSYPLRYGYLHWDPEGTLAGNNRFNRDPYLVDIGQFRAMDVYDEFCEESHDTNRNGAIEPLEFCPVGQPSLTNPGAYVFPEDLYPAGVQAQADAALQLNEQRPYVYIPVNMRQFERVQKFYFKGYENAGDDAERRAYMNAEVWDFGNPLLSGLQFPPPRYDAYVLIGVGPAGSTAGVLPEPLGTEPPEALYHMLGLRAFFLATRDANQNGVLDFDFRARTRQDEQQALAGMPGNLGFLPDGTMGAGPLITKQEG